MNRLYDPSAPKRAANLSINSSLLEQARQMRLNLSATLERALREELRARKSELWRKDNQEAIAEANRLAEESGLFSDGFRSL